MSDRHAFRPGPLGPLAPTVGGASVAPVRDAGTATAFVPSPVTGSLGEGAAAADVAERARAAGWAAGWAAGTRAAADAAQAQHDTLAAEHAAGEAAREARVAAAVAVLHRAADAAAARVVPVLEDAAVALDEGAVLLAQAVLGVELARGEDRARGALARALGLPLDAGLHTVRLHPADLAMLTAIGAPVPVDVRLVPDPSLQPGDAVSELADGFLDARIATAVERAARALAVLPEEAA